MIKQKNKYPFNEGDSYYTIENEKIIYSVWDDVSENELHTPSSMYFETKKIAELYMKTQKQICPRCQSMMCPDSLFLAQDRIMYKCSSCGRLKIFKIKRDEH